MKTKVKKQKKPFGKIKESNTLQNWVIDLSMSQEGVICFVPVDSGNNLIFGLNVLSGECPGNLVGVYHSGGADKANQWLKENPDWKSRYSNKESKKHK